MNIFSALLIAIVTAIILLSSLGNLIFLKSEEVKEKEIFQRAKNFYETLKRIEKIEANNFFHEYFLGLSNVSIKNGILSIELEGKKFNFFIGYDFDEAEIKNKGRYCILKIAEKVKVFSCEEYLFEDVGECNVLKCKLKSRDCLGPNKMCIGDGFCNTFIKENCKNSIDCDCKNLGSNYICCPENPNSDEKGCLKLESKKKKGEECYCNEECEENLECNLVDPSFTSYKKACCEKGKSWNGKECVEILKFCPSDTPCKNFWPAHEGTLLFINEPNYACDLFEICHPFTQRIAEEAYNCCRNECSGDCHSYCKEALKYSGYDKDKSKEKLKFCMGLYVTSGFGPASRWMHRYDLAEVCCAAGYNDELKYYCIALGGSVDYFGKCLPHIPGTLLDRLPCQGIVSMFPRGWKSDTNINENSCYFSDLPAHVNYGILKTGVCTDYSVSVTTVLRAIGYTKDEVFTVIGPEHAYNLVKFPGMKKYTVIDTTGNKGENWRPGQNPTNWYPHCEYKICMNDNGYFNCPPQSEVEGC